MYDISVPRIYHRVSDTQQSNIAAMIVSLQRHIEQRMGGAREQQFFSHSLEYLTTSSGRQIQMESWMVTTYDVEFGHEIGSGGL